MSNDVLITPGSRKIEFKDSSGNVDAVIQTDSSGNLSITNTGGDLSLGDTSSDVFIGDGTNNIDLVFEQNGEIRGTSGVTVTVGASGSTVNLAGTVQLGGTTISSTGAELNILDGVTATAAEINKLDGVTATTAELNILDGVTATATELNLMDGVTATTTELNHVDGVTSAIQTQLDAKLPLAGGTMTGELHVQNQRIKVSGSSTGFTEGEILLQNDGATGFRGNGIYMYDAGSDIEWYAGRPYASNDQYIIARQTSVADGSQAGSTAQTSSAVFTVDSSGNAGIGTASPDGLLHVSSGTSGDATVIIEADTDNDEEGDIPQLWFKADGDRTEAALRLNNNELQIISNVSTSSGIEFLTGTTNNTGTTDPGNGATKRMGIDASGIDVTGSITVSGTVDGRDVAADGATADAALPKAGGTMTGNIVFGDNVDAQFGAGTDLVLRHNGANSVINNNAGNLIISQFANDSDIVINSDDGSGSTANYFRADGSTGDAILYHYGTEKLKTQSGGVDVSGDITVSGTVDGRDVATDGTKLDGIEASAEVNQNAFSNVAVSGQTTVAADGKTDTLTLAAGSNVTITTNATSDTVTIASTAATSLSDLSITATATEINKLDGATVTTAEINILDGVTATATELNILDGVTSTTAELNILDGVTATATELNLMDGVTATTTELNYVDGVTSAIQTQLDGKLSTSGGTLTGNLIFEGATADAHETTVTVTDPTADRTITLPDATGTVILNSNLNFPFFQADGSSDTIALTADLKVPFTESDGSTNNISLTT